MSQRYQSASDASDADAQQVALSPDELESGVHRRNTTNGDFTSVDGATVGQSLGYSGPAPKLASKSFKTWPIAIWFIMSSEFCERCVGLRFLDSKPCAITISRFLSC